MKPKYWLLAGLALLAGIAVSLYINSPAPAKQGSSDIRLEQIKLPDLDGNLQPLAQWQGKLLLVNFWATWCPPCREEMPLFVSMRNKYKKKGFEVVGISIDSVQEVRMFRDSLGIDFPLLDGEKDGLSLMATLGNRLGALPYSVLFDRNGNPVHYKSGEFKRDELQKLLGKHL